MRDCSPQNREDASSMVTATAGATANAMEGNSSAARARESGLLCLDSHYTAHGERMASVRVRVRTAYCAFIC